MKKKFSLLLFVLMLLLTFGACQKTITTSTADLLAQDPTVSSGYLVDDPQDGTILHAWNWSLANIEAHLEEIAIAGFSSVQISPLQPQKDYFGAATWGSSWWKLYQPLGFSIATADNPLGSRDDLESLCGAADLYGIKIIVDVVANHLAGDDSQTLNAGVEAYEPVIYEDNLIHLDNGMAGDGSILAVVRGALGDFPDLQTENESVQERVLSLLKEYVDAGVDGFRFDAAKHIETPSDGEYASDFWPYVIDGVKDYVQGKGITDLYFYGEILNTAGTDRSYTEYTGFMSVTANSLSDTIRNAVTTKNSDRFLSAEYITGVPAAKSVLWAESHDNYASGATDGVSDASITKAYVVAASRKDATTLYFARPGEATFMGEVGSYLWESPAVAAINRFHNYFVGADESISVGDGFFLNERFADDRAGVVIVDILGNGEVAKLPVSHLADGYYHDQVNGGTFTVKDGKLSGTIAEGGIAIVYNNSYEPKPAVYVSDDGVHGSFTDTKTVTAYSYNTTEAYYSLNGGDPVAFSGTVDITLSHPDQNATVTLDFELYYDTFVIERHYEYVKSNVVVTEVTVNNLDQDYVGNQVLVAWAWPQGGEGHWLEGTFQDGTFTFSLTPGDKYFLLVLFPPETVNYDWSIKSAQTNDVEIPADGIYDGSLLIWG